MLIRPAFGKPLALLSFNIMRLWYPQVLPVQAYMSVEKRYQDLTAPGSSAGLGTLQVLNKYFGGE